MTYALSFDYGLFVTAFGYLIGVIAAIIAIFEWTAKRDAEKRLRIEKEDGFISVLTHMLLLEIPQLPEFGIRGSVQFVAYRHLKSFLKVTDVQDNNYNRQFWDKVSSELAERIESNAKRHSPLDNGLAECITYLFLFHQSRERAYSYLNRITEKDSVLAGNVAKYYFAFKKDPKSLADILRSYASCGDTEAKDILTSLNGEQVKKILGLLSSQKWNEKVARRLQAVMNEKEVSYHSIASKLIEIAPSKRQYLVFKNEGSGPQVDDPTLQQTGAIRQRLQDFRGEGKADLIAGMAPVYFFKDKSARDEFLAGLPKRENDNYVVFSAELDPYTFDLKYSDAIKGKPAQLFSRLASFLQVKASFDVLSLNLGIKPVSIIEGAGLDFLLIAKNSKLSECLRSNSENILKKLNEQSNKQFSILTDLRQMDDNDVGYAGTLISDACGLKQSRAKEIAEEIRTEAKTLYESLYGSTMPIARVNEL